VAFDPIAKEDFSCQARCWGGEMRGEQVGICKHLLAVLIGERLRVIPEKQADMYTLAQYAMEG
jgi:hypothetical protein